MIKSPQHGGKAHGGPFNGRVLAFDRLMMSVRDDTGKQIGAYFWTDDHWEYESDDGKPEELYP